MTDKKRDLICKIISFILLWCSVLGITACSNSKTDISENSKQSASFFAMDTLITVTAYGDQAKAAEEAAKSRMNELEKKWSVTDNDSEIYKVNSGSGSVKLSDETASLVKFALEMGEETQGSLDISMYPVVAAWGFTTDEHRVPSDDELEELLKNVGYDRIVLEEDEIKTPDGMMIDLGAVGKGYAGDLLAKDLKDKGISSAILDLGGNIQTIGKKPDGSSWKVGIRNPFDGTTLGVVEIGEKAVVTSGGYERYFEENGEIYWHILDPKTGRPAHSGLVSVTVIGDEGRLCDALSTAIFVMGLDKAKELWEKRSDFDFVAVTDSGEIYITKGVAADFSLSEQHRDMKLNTIEKK